MALEPKNDTGAERNQRGRVRRGSLGGWFVLIMTTGVVLAVCAAFFVWLKLQQFNFGYRLAQCQDRYEQLMADQRKLHLEWSRLQDPFHMERMARERFGLTPPQKDQRLLIR